MTMRSLLVSTLWTLPYELRQLVYRVAEPQVYRNLRRLRPGPESDYPLKPFDQHRCIFVHIPKCAGISVATTLFHGLGGAHTTIRQYQLVFTKREFDEYFKFTFVRNPWDRLVSAFHFLRAGGMHGADRGWAQANLAQYSDFDDFVRRWVNKTNVMSSWIHFLPQSYFIHDPGSNHPRVDFIGYYENLQHDFSYIARRLGVAAELKELNKGKKKQTDYREYYTETTKRIVADVYDADIHCFGYDFDNSMLRGQLARRDRRS
jgi:hypothetical protein